jgi:ribonucleoside-diphosphate reductase alpha chain
MKRKYTYDEVLKASLEYFHDDDFAAKVFADKYSLQDREGNYYELTPDDMHRRLAKEFARIEAKYPNPLSEEEIYQYFKNYEYIVPQGSPMSAVGNPYQIQSISNCFVVGHDLFDSYGGICRTDEQLAQISKRRGGVGINLSSLRPKGLATKNAAKTTDGIGVYMDRFSNTIREVGQCIAEGQKVLTKNGLKPIELVKVNDLVWTKKGWISVVKTLNNGTKNVFELTTKRGYKIKATKEHVFLTAKDGNTVECQLGDFNIGNNIVLIPGTHSQNKEYIKLSKTNYNRYTNDDHGQLNENVNQPTVLDEDLAYLLGFSYGNGYVELDKFNDPRLLQLSVSWDWKSVEEKLVKIISDKFNYKADPKKGDGKVNVVTIHSKMVLAYLHDNNLLKEKANKISFPNKILQSPTSVQIAFISGYFDADGYASGKKKGYAFSSIQKEFLQTLQSTLMSLGIVSRLHVEDRSDKENWNDLWTLNVTGRVSQNTLVQLFKDQSCKISSSMFIAKRDNLSTPFKTKAFGIKGSNYSFCNDSQYLSANAFIQAQQLNLIKDELLVVDEIESIIEAGEINTYDLQLESEHLFWCEGFYVHNSGRRGALMELCSVHHPEITTFITIKQNPTKVTGANISVQLTDEFMNAVKNDTEYEQRFPVDSTNPQVRKMVRARDVWDLIVKSAHTSAEPGLLFWDNIINNSPADCYVDDGFKTVGTNPCSELPLNAGGQCILMTLNLYSYVVNPFTEKAYFNYELFYKHSTICQKLIDDLVDIELESIQKIIDKIESDPEPLHIKENELSLWKLIYKSCENGRRTGTGIVGLGDALAAINVRYGSPESVAETEKIYKTLALGCYRATVDLAKERGPFPIFDHKKEENHPFLTRLWNEDPDLYKEYLKYGRRNIALNTTAPTGSLATQTQTTSGIEPAFLLSYTRRKKINYSDKNARVDFVDAMGDKWQEFTVYHHHFKTWMDITGKTNVEESPYWKATSNDVDWVISIDLQAAAQKYIDHAISKTCNLPNNTSVELVGEIYMRAWESGCKGFTIYRDGCRDGVLISNENSSSSNKKTPVLTRPAEIQEAYAPKRPKELKCDIHRMSYKGQKWIALVGLMNGVPYELFTGFPETLQIPEEHKTGVIKKMSKGVYSLHIPGDDSLTVDDLVKSFNNSEFTWATRMISMSLRHGVPMDFLVDQLSKEGNVTDINKVLSRVLKKYIKEGTKNRTGTVCEACGSKNLIYSEGCLKCLDCPHSKCG